MKTSIEQWESLCALQRYGSVSIAAEKLGKSQSTISYMLKELQEALDIQLLMKKGRATTLNENGEILADRAGILLRHLANTEALASLLGNGAEATIRLVVDTSFPQEITNKVLSQFNQLKSGTRIELREEVMSGVNDYLLEKTTDLAIGMTPPPGFLSDRIIDIEFVMVCSQDYFLNTLRRRITAEDLEEGTQVVVRDSGPRDITFGWLSPTNRWTASNLNSAYNLIKDGLCFGRLPKHWIEEDIKRGTLVAVDMIEGASY
ncbi:LysR family transcriptional regulator, partial [Photobacterium sp. OFAV2-7]|uniref:LysR family transcriptional regulator n=1 Tax=Photobacterium sp. OFAV2-7 TaxID=2917748 RepID=UPI001EF61C89